jgi:hypothetical protein
MYVIFEHKSQQVQGSLSFTTNCTKRFNERDSDRAIFTLIATGNPNFTMSLVFPFNKQLWVISSRIACLYANPCTQMPVRKCPSIFPRASGLPQWNLPQAPDLPHFPPKQVTLLPQASELIPKHHATQYVAGCGLQPWRVLHRALR